jgi:hypothetical protein
VNPKDDKKQFITNAPTPNIAPLPYEMIMSPSPQTPMAQPIQYQLYPTPQPQAQQSQAKKKQFTVGQLVLLIIGIAIFISLPPPIDLIGLGLVIYAVKKYWSGKS